MAVRIRLKRLGAKKAPFYRIVVADSRTSRNGRSIEEIGIYDPTKEPVVLKVDAEAANKWLANGAQPSDTVKALLKKAGVIGEFIAKRLVEHPEQVVVAETNNERALILELKVAPEDMGKVIGKQGRIAKAIRTVVKAAGIHEDKKIIVESVQ